MNGLIGFFDILGYQNFLENNSAMKSALDVLEIITDMPKKINYFTSSITEHLLPGDRVLHESLSHLVFSDTIVFTLSYPEDVDESWMNRARTFMASCSALLAAEMFEKGLPIRGVIHEGEFITKDMCIAGKGIVEAYRLCASLDISGIVFSQELGNKMLKLVDDESKLVSSRFIFPYLTPLNNGSECRLVNINWFNYMFDFKHQNDVEAYVLESFWAHQKDCSNAVETKLRNTTKLIRKMLQIRRTEDNNRN